MGSDISTRFISIHTLSNRFEADLLVDALRKEGIVTILRSFEETAYDGLFVCQKGWGWIMVPEEEASRALGIIRPLIHSIQSKTIYQDPGEIDPNLWERLRTADPDFVCRNAGVVYDFEKNAYSYSFLNAEFLCFPKEGIIVPSVADSYVSLDFEFYLVTLHYLLESSSTEPAGKWVSEKDLPGGEIFFRGPHALPVHILKDIFGNQPELLTSTAVRLGGIQERMGDLSYRFQTFPKVPLALVLWEGDEEFDPSVSFLFDSTIAMHFHRLDTIFALVNVLTRALKTCVRS